MMILLGKSGIIQLIYSAEVKNQTKLSICSCGSQLNCETAVKGVWEGGENKSVSSKMSSEGMS